MGRCGISEALRWAGTWLPVFGGPEPCRGQEKYLSDVERSIDTGHEAEKMRSSQL